MHRHNCWVLIYILVKRDALLLLISEILLERFAHQSEVFLRYSQFPDHSTMISPDAPVQHLAGQWLQAFV